MMTIKIHSSCEIEDFVETHICKLCVITPIARITGCVSSLSCVYRAFWTRANYDRSVNPFTTGNWKPVFGDKITWM